MTSVCTGSLILGAAGVLRGKRATSHWIVRDLLGQFAATPTAGRVVRDGEVITAAGLSAGLDLGLAIAAELRGQDAVQAILLVSEYDPEPPFPGGSPETARPEIVDAVRRGGLSRACCRRGVASPCSATDLATMSKADNFASILGCRSGPVQLVGISYGGLVATRLAARHPSLVSDLILISSAATFSDEGLSRVRRQIALVSQRRYPEFLAEFGGVFRRPWWRWLLRARLLARRTSLVGEMNPPGEITAYLRAGLAAGESDASVWLRRIAARTLVIGGARDQFFGERIAETASAIDDARLHLLPKETHMAPVERVRDFRREIATFLAGGAPKGEPPVHRAMVTPKNRRIVDA